MPLDSSGNDLKRYKKDISVFVETGTANGDGVQSALNADFKTLYSIELSTSLYQGSKSRFSGNENVSLICGSSNEELPKIMNKINTPFLLWLDAHNSGGPYIGELMHNYLPVELKSIIPYKNKFKDSVIMIDDMGYYLHDKEFCSMIEDLILEIKSNATLEYYNPEKTSFTILVAK
jgi:hypothetical protein